MTCGKLDNKEHKKYHHFIESYLLFCATRTKWNLFYFPADIYFMSNLIRRKMLWIVTFFDASNDCHSIELLSVKKLFVWIIFCFLCFRQIRWQTNKRWTKSNFMTFNSPWETCWTFRPLEVEPLWIYDFA